MSNSNYYQSMKLVLRIEDPDEICHSAITPDGKMFAVNSYYPVKVRSTETGELIHTLHPDGVAYSLAISKDGQMLAAGCRDVTTSLWNLQTGKKLNTFNITKEFPKEVRCVGFTPDNKGLLSAWGSETNYWDLETGKENYRKSIYGCASQFVISEDGQIILCNHLSDLKIIQFSNHACLHRLERPLPLPCISSIAMNQAIKKFAIGNNDGTIVIFSTETMEELINWKAHTSYVFELIFCPDNQTIISGSKDKLIHFWNLHTGEKIHTLEGHPYGVHSMSLSADGKTLISTSGRPTLKKDVKSVINIWGIDA